MTEKNTGIPRLALRWPTEVAQALGIAPLELEQSGLAAHIRVWTIGRTQVVALAELERLLDRPATDEEGDDAA